MSEPTAATSNYLTFEGELSSPKAHLKISNQNALLSLMSHEDLEGIKNQIHSRINKIMEANNEDDPDQQSKREDDEG